MKNKVQYLPRCKHGNCLCDWSGEWLKPPCNCDFNNTSRDNQKKMSYLKLAPSFEIKDNLL